jgi:long-subunit acyl-CoA synthetase (AMP-forming)
MVLGFTPVAGVEARLCVWSNGMPLECPLSYQLTLCNLHHPYTEGTVTVFGFNAPEWHISAMGAIFAGGKPAGIYPTDTPEVIAYKTNHSNAQIAVVEVRAY